jgi:hypothetical protein
MKEIILQKENQSVLTEDEVRLKHVVKAALKEILVEERDLLFEQLLEFMEDVAFGKLMKEADNGDYASEDEVLKVLRG